MTPEQLAAIEAARARIRSQLSPEQAQAIEAARARIASRGQRDDIYAGVSARAAAMDPAERQQRQHAADAAAMGQIDAAQQEQFIRDNPLGARAAAAVQGIPFAGEYVDEAFGVVSPEARDRVRYAQEAMRETRPGQTAALQVGTGIVSSLPAAMAIAPRVMQGTTLAGNVIRGMGAGAALGGAEGAVSGFGAGEGGASERMRSAGERGFLGAGLGGAIGGIAPAFSAGLRNLLGRFRSSDVQTIAREFGVSPDAARAVRSALDAEDFAGAQAAIDRAGGRAMLADAGEATRTLLDASMTGSARAARVGREAVDARAQAGGREFVEVMDRFFGRPQGIETARRAVRSASAAGRQAAYDAAYAAPIDYAGRAGRRIEGLIGRVPGSVVARANRLMQLDGDRSRQILAQIGNNGSVTFQQMPDVRQLDYITRALNDLAESGEARGAMGGMTAESRALSGLAREIRDTLRGAVPEYNVALRLGSDTIRQSQAVRTGAQLLMPSTTREQAREAILGMTAAERTQARQGLRSYIDDLMARTQQALTDPNMDAREAISAWRALSSRRAQENIAELMGQARATGLAREVDRIATDFELRAAVAQNSRTAVRQSVQGEVRQAAAPGLLDTIAETGSPGQAMSRIIQALTGADPGARAAREAGLFSEIAEALTRTRGSAEARRIMSVVGRSMGSEPISRARAEHIARLLTTGAAGGAYQTGTQYLATR